MTTGKSESIRYSVECICGNQMRVRKRHFGRMCRCTQCKSPIYVTFENVTPPLTQRHRNKLRFYKEEDVPLHWQRGDLLMELYEVRGSLGEGAIGQVYRVHHRGWDMDLAVKSPKSKPRSTDEWLAIFEHECETWINLIPHPHTVECFYVRKLGGIPRIFAEYVDGRDLHRRVDDGTLYAGSHQDALRRILDIAIQAAWGLEHAHTQGVIHQDVKSSNILVSSTGEAKVTDFGLARLMSNLKGEGQPSTRPIWPFGGTPAYCSPDHELDEEITFKTDMWSWGVSLLEMFAGEVFWRHGKNASRILSVLTEEEDRPPQIPPVPREIASLLASCFEEAPSNRPADMGEVSAVVRHVYAELMGEPYPRKPPSQRELTRNALNNRGVSLLDMGRTVEALQTWETLTRQNPDHMEALFNLHLYQWRSGRLNDGEIISILRKTMDDANGQWLPACMLSRVLIESGDAIGAVNLLKSRGGDLETAPREVSFALAIGQSRARHDKRLYWECRDAHNPVTAVALSEGGSRAFTGHADGRIQIWDVTAQQMTMELTGHDDAVTGLALNESRGIIVSSSIDGAVKVWRVLTGLCVWSFDGHTDKVKAIALSKKGDVLVSAGRDGMAMVWDPQNGDLIRTYDGHTDAIYALDITADGHYAVSGGKDCTARIWDVRTGETLTTLAGNFQPITACNFSPTRSVVVTASGRKIKVWDRASGILQRAIRAHTNKIEGLRLSADGRFAVSATRAGTFKVWSLKEGQCLRTFYGYAPVALSGDNRFVITGGLENRFSVWSMHLNEQPFRAPYLVCL